MTVTMSLRDSWSLRNAAAETLIKSEENVRRVVETATLAEIVGLLEGFSPARSPGPDWTRSFDALIERLWMWSDSSTLSAVEAEFRARGKGWEAVANALTPAH